MRCYKYVFIAVIDWNINKWAITCNTVALNKENTSWVLLASLVVFCSCEVETWEVNLSVG